MKALVPIAALALAGCNVTVDNQAVDNRLGAAANDFANVTNAADQAAANAAGAIENQTEAIKNGVDVDVHLRGRAESDNSNKQ
jgi:cell division protein ZapA (FtsZ GTPase activity inhibitor)